MASAKAQGRIIFNIQQKSKKVSGIREEGIEIRGLDPTPKLLRFHMTGLATCP
jgi:hypothetical protein